MTEFHRFRRGLGWHSLVPPFWVLILLTGMAGGVFGLGSFTFIFARGYSYLSDDPRACANCHVMQEVFDGWNHGSHKAVAVCNDCHTPHDLLGHYLVKGLNGWRHSEAFTTGDFAEPIRITDSDRAVAWQNCLRCHGELTAMISHSQSPDPTDCLRCHADVGHGK